MPAFRVVPENGPDNKNESLGRANAAKFLERLCPYHGLPQVIAEAERHIFEAHAERMTEDKDKPATVEGIVQGRAPLQQARSDRSARPEAGANRYGRRGRYGLSRNGS